MDTKIVFLTRFLTLFLASFSVCFAYPTAINSPNNANMTNSNTPSVPSDLQTPNKNPVGNPTLDSVEGENSPTTNNAPAGTNSNIGAGGQTVGR